MQDIGILASTDPVALVQACLDLVYAVTPTEGTTTNRSSSALKAAAERTWWNMQSESDWEAETMR